MRLAPSCVLLSGLLLCALAAGQEPQNQAAPTFSLQYSAPAICPGRAELVRELEARLPGAREVASGQARLQILVEIEKRGGGVSGTIHLGMPENHQETGREIPEATCAEVIASMAVIVAMSLDSGPAPAQPAPVEPGVPDEGPPSPSVAPPSSTPLPSTAPKADAAPNPNPREPSAPPSRRPVGRAIRFRGLLGGGVETAVAPNPALRFAVGLEASLPGGAPSVRLMASWAEPAQREVTTFGSAQFRRMGLGLAACPWRWSLVRRLDLVPCAALELGQLTGEGENTFDKQTQHMLWLGFGGATRLEARLWPSVSLELEVGLKGLVRQDRFVFQPNLTVHDVPVLAGSLTLGLAIGAP